jgi:hypothetical protein
MGEDQPAGSGAESAPPTEAPAVVPQRTAPRPSLPRLSFPRAAAPPDGQARRGACADPVTWAIAAAVFGAYTAISVFRLMQLGQYTFDLGIYTDYSPPIQDVPAFIASLFPPGTYAQIFSSGDVYVFGLTR